MGRLKVPAVLFDLALTPYQLRRSAPILGRHNLPVLTELLGLSEEEYLALARIHRRTPMDGVRTAEGGG